MQLGKSRQEKLARLVETSLVINSTLQIEPLLREIMDVGAEIAEAQSASILLFDNNTQELHFMAFTSDSDKGHTSRLRRIPVPLKNSIAGTIFTENRALAINDVSEYEGHYSKADQHSGFSTSSVIGVPMRIRDNVIGVLEAVNKLNRESWTEDDTYLLQILAAQAAIAIENASLVTQLRKAFQELNQLAKMKDDFIAIASHELRTPLGVILGYASFLKDESEGTASEHADAVMNSALRMRQIIEDMTNLRNLKIGESELERENTAVEEIMMNALTDVQSLTDAQGHKLHYMMPPKDIRIFVDRAKMGMALTNLLNNAIKFSPDRGFIELGYMLQDGEIWILVRDQGIGIPKEHQERIFEEFTQVEDHMTRRHNGMGLGLAIAKAVVLAHKGRIWVESAGENKGATFYISLPLVNKA